MVDTAERLRVPMPATAPAGAAAPCYADPDLPAAAQRVEVRIGAHGTAGELAVVADARGLVVFAHGSRRHAVRHRRVAEILHGYRLDTLLLDPTTPAEDAERERAFDRAFDLDWLGQRLDAALLWSRTDPHTGRLCTGLFGASSGAAAALHAAACHPGWVTAVVAGGGRTDLMTTARLARVQAPTLLIVGGHDSDVLQLNRSAMRALRCESRLEVVAGATHLFEEPGAIETVAHLAGCWFANHLPLRLH